MIVHKGKERRISHQENQNPEIIIFQRRVEKKARDRRLEKEIRKLELEWGHGGF